MGKRYKLSLLILLTVWSATNLRSQHQLKDSTLVKEWLLIADEHYYKDDLDSATYYCLRAGELARKIQYTEGIADYIGFYIPVLNRLGKYHEALKLGNEAVKVATDLKDNARIARAYNNIANEYQYLGDFKSAATHYLNALVFSENTNLPRMQLRYSNNLASVFLQMEDTSKSYHYALKSYEIASEIQDSLGMASSLVNVSLAEIMMKKYDEAVRHLDLVLMLGKALKDDSYVLDAYINRGDVESARKDYHNALAFYNKSLKVSQNYPAPDYELYIYWGLAKNHFLLKSYNQADAYLEKSIAIAQDLSAFHELTKLYQLGSEINEAMNRFNPALQYRKQYEHLHDSLANAETQKNIHQLETEYRTTQKEKAIAEQKLTIANNTAQMARKDRMIMLSTAITILLLSGIIIFIIAVRNRQRANQKELKLIEHQNDLKILTASMEGQEKERSRLAKDLHDGVGGILSAAKMHLSVAVHHHDHPKFSKLEDVMTMIDQASQEIRTIAHNLSPNIVTVHDLDTAIVSFCDRVKSETLDIEHYILGDIPKLKTNFKLIVYRAVQELINNIIKHAQASHAIVQLSVHDDALLLTVEDNGKGFDTETTNGIGLLNLRARVSEVNGTLQIHSQPGQGTTVNLEFNISKYKENNQQHLLVTSI